MDYINYLEVPIFAPQISRNNNIRTQAQRIPYIRTSSSTIDGFCFRSKYGLEVRDHYNVRVDLSANLTGRLPNTPFIGWLSASAELFKFGNSQKINDVTLADFSVDPDSGLIRNLTAQALNVGSGDVNFKSSFGEVQMQHRSEKSNAEDNPYYMNVDFRAGLFTEKIVSPSGAIGADYVTVNNLTGLRQGAEFYFDTDITLELGVDKRYITELDVDNLQVYFEPSLVVGFAIGTKLRQVDKSVRAACAEIIADLITYPPNTKTFIKNLGRFDLQKQWSRRNGFSIPNSAAEKLETYSRV